MAVNVDEAMVTEVVFSVLPIEIVQFDVFNVALRVTSRITAVDCVELTKIAVAVLNGTSTRYHEVPSFAIAQSTEPTAVDATGKKRFVAETVFGVVV